MPIIGDIYNFLFFAPIVNLIVFIIRILEAAHIPGALGFAIIILTIIIRALIWPLMSAQIKSAKKMADLRPYLEDLKTKHGSDKQALAQAQMALYKEHGINPAAGCLPIIIQIPPMIAIYQVIYAFFEGEAGLAKINSVLYFPSWHLETVPDLYFFGVNLAAKPSEFQTIGTAVLLVPIITGLLQFLQAKMMTPKPVMPYPDDSAKERKEKQAEDTMLAVQSQMAYLMPLMIAYVSYTFPIGLALYWNTLTIIGIWQQKRIAGWGGLAVMASRLKGKKKSK